MKIPGLDQSYIRRHAAEGSFERGMNYHRSGAVVSLKRTTDATVDALVKGSQYSPYSVRIRHGAEHVTSVECSCPYFAGAWCKHVVASLLACLDEDEGTARLDSVSKILEHLDAASVRDLLDKVADRHPEVLGWLRAELRQL